MGVGVVLVVVVGVLLLLVAAAAAAIEAVNNSGESRMLVSLVLKMVLFVLVMKWRLTMVLRTWVSCCCFCSCGDSSAAGEAYTSC